MNYDILKESLKKLIGHFTTPEFNEELADAKSQFFGNTGTLDENLPNYNLRMHQFYEWFFLTRPLKSYMKPPLLVCEQQRGLRLNSEDEEVIKILLMKQQHRLFEYIKSKKDIIIVRDLLSNKKNEIQDCRFVFGFDSKEYFQARIVEIENKNYFLNSFCFHPESSQKFIQAEIKKIQENPDLSLEDLLMRLNKMRYKFEQYKHVRPENIYTNENKLGL
jgi:hypothetical protein